MKEIFKILLSIFGISMVKRPSESVTVPIVEFSTEILAPMMGAFVCALISQSLTTFQSVEN
jgi:hypothetical protein